MSTINLRKMCGFPYHLPGSPFLTHSVLHAEVVLRSCQCYRVEQFQLLKGKYGESTCPCEDDPYHLNESVLSLELGQSYLRSSNVAEVNLSLGWYAKHMREMFYAFSLALHVTTLVPGFQSALFEPFSFSFDKCGRSTCLGTRDSTYLINGKCSSCFSVEIFEKLFYGIKRSRITIKEKCRSFTSTLLRTMLFVHGNEEERHFEEDFFWSSVVFDFAEHVFVPVVAKFGREETEPLLRDPYTKPLGCPDGVDPLEFVINRISEEAKSNRLYGDYTHRWGLLGSAPVSEPPQVNENRGKVLTYDYEELRKKVLIRP